jgi:ubiquinone/menaquinone biosynthesis C-methylase UbiE
MAPERRSLDFGRVAESYERVQVPAIFALWAADLLELAALRPGERLLDLACGTGIVARLAAPRVGPAGRVVGVDVNQGMLAVARSRPAPAGAAIEWRQESATALALPDATFDVVLCQQGLQHIPDRSAAVREMRRVLVPGGRALASVFRRRVDQEVWERVTAPFIGEDAASRIRGPSLRITADELAALFHEAGFRSVGIQTR